MICRVKEAVKQSRIGQTQRVYNAFLERPKTMLEVSKETGIERANICRYVANMYDSGLIQIHHYGYCPISGASHVQFLTTDERLFAPSFVHPSLFD